MDDMAANEQDRKQSRHGQVVSRPVPESPKTTIRWDDGLKADAERCAQERGISVAEFVRQAVAHYVGWCEALKDKEPPR